MAQGSSYCLHVLGITVHEEDEVEISTCIEHRHKYTLSQQFEELRAYLIRNM